MGIKSAAVSLLAAPPVGRALRGLGRGRLRSLRFPDLCVDVDSPAVSDRSAALIFWGVYESAEVRFIRRYLRRDLDAIELGSSIGFVSSALARRLEPGRRLLCVEANEQLLPVLQRNLARNAAHLDARVLHAAIGYERETVVFASGAENTAGRVVADAREPAAGAVRVPAATLAGLLERGGIDGDYVLVADIEGSEAAIVAREDDALRRCRQLVLELHANDAPPPHDSVEGLLGALVERHGFVLRARRGPVCVLDRPARRG